jgi:hypothetical protein
MCIIYMGQTHSTTMSNYLPCHSSIKNENIMKKNLISSLIFVVFFFFFFNGQD